MMSHTTVIPLYFLHQKGNSAIIHFAVGMDKVARVVSSGSDVMFMIRPQWSTEMLRYYRSAEVVIAKGPGI